MRLTADHLAIIAGRRVNANMRSTVAGLARGGVGAGLERPHRLAHYLAQLAHESGGWRYDQEVWGPTPAQKRYDTRTNLGNTAAADGDGFKYRGLGPIQLTGKTRYIGFTAWARAMDPAAPDFVLNPEAVLTDPWEGLSSIWYWDRHGLNRYADLNGAGTLTRRINGGLNGYQDRLARYTRAALVLLGYGPTEIVRFQRDAGLATDGIAGPDTREALHKRLIAMPPISFGTPTSEASRPEPRPAILPEPLPGPAPQPGGFLAAIAAFFAALFRRA